MRKQFSTVLFCSALVLTASAEDKPASSTVPVDCAAAAAKALTDSTEFLGSYCNYGSSVAADEITPIKGSSNSYRWRGFCEGSSKTYTVKAKDKDCTTFTVR
jgi:hypothetical protein